MTAFLRAAISASTDSKSCADSGNCQKGRYQIDFLFDCGIALLFRLRTGFVVTFASTVEEITFSGRVIRSKLRTNTKGTAHHRHKRCRQTISKWLEEGMFQNSVYR